MATMKSSGRGATSPSIQSEVFDLAVVAAPAKKYDSLPAHLKYVMDATLKPSDEQKYVVIPDRKMKSDLQFDPEIVSPKAVKSTALLDHELVQYKTIKDPKIELKKKKDWKVMQQSTKVVVDKKVEVTDKLIKSQSSPELIRTSRAKEFFKLREHNHELVDVAKSNAFHTTIDQENEPILPWKSIHRKPKKIKKPLSPYRLDATGGKGNQDRNLSKFQSERTSRSENTKYQPPKSEAFQSKPRDIIIRPKLGFETIRVLNPSNNSSQIVQSEFFQVPNEHVVTPHLHESPPPSRQERGRQRKQRMSPPVDMTELRDIYRSREDENNEIESRESDNNTDITDSLSVKDNPPIIALKPQISATITQTRNKQSLQHVANKASLDDTITDNSSRVIVHRVDANANLLHRNGMPKSRPLIRAGLTFKTPPSSPSPMHSAMARASRLLSPLASVSAGTGPGTGGDGGRGAGLGQSMEERADGSQVLISKISEMDSELKYIYGSPSAASNLHSPMGFPSTDELIMSKMMMSSVTYEHGKRGSVNMKLTAAGPNPKYRLSKLPAAHHNINTMDPYEEDHNNHNNNNKNNNHATDEAVDDELNSIGSEHLEPKPRAPPRTMGLGIASSLNVTPTITETLSIRLEGVPIPAPPTKEELSAAQRSRLRDEEIKRRADAAAAAAEKERLRMLVEEHGLEIASKIEAKRRKRLKKQKALLESVAIYSIASGGCSLVPRHVARADAVPLTGITKVFQWEQPEQEQQQETLQQKPVSKSQRPTSANLQSKRKSE